MTNQNHEFKVRHFCPKFYEFILRENFEYSCLEAEYLGIKKTTREFHDLCKLNRLEALANAWGVIETMHEGERFELKPYTREQMKEIILKKYKR